MKSKIIDKKVHYQCALCKGFFPIELGRLAENFQCHECRKEYKKRYNANPRTKQHYAEKVKQYNTKVDGVSQRETNKRIKDAIKELKNGELL